MALNDDILAAKAIISKNEKLSNNRIFHDYSSVYRFTNENISAYYNRYDIKDKDMLTVCASGDHILEAILRDVKKVDCFDINIFTEYFMNLKLAAVLTFNINEFIDYFCFNDKPIFNIEQYLKLRDNLRLISEDSCSFWDYLYSKFDEEYLYRSRFFVTESPNIAYLTRKNSYLNEDKYKELKKKLEKYMEINKKINFIKSDITNITSSVDKKYDLMILSNIASYMNDIYKENSIDNFYSLVVDELSKIINKDGIIEVAYLYSGCILKEFYKKCLENPDFSVIRFPNLTYQNYSYVLSYKK